ncbi:hypothetical protein HNP92_002011 [Methanococcus maripaludis]|uniref:Uncharacterized protein n=1 Tax=Methanococcus maripaludis TaxID=39152 RepID=A0A7J9S9H0_METMI|nr:hypothetical protein [Methanococcus maripaludis]MBB6402686.1 hypothetical protein [Methanococcus maripaludis]
MASELMSQVVGILAGGLTAIFVFKSYELLKPLFKKEESEESEENTSKTLKCSN